MKNKIFVIPYGSYVNKLYYPDCELSKSFCLLLKQKTLTDKDLEIIKSMGYLVRTRAKSL